MPALSAPKQRAEKERKHLYTGINKHSHIREGYNAIKSFIKKEFIHSLLLPLTRCKDNNNIYHGKQFCINYNKYCR